MKKKINWKYIFIPTVAITTVSAIAIPMSIISSNWHIKFAAEADISGTADSNNLKVYELILKESAQEGQTLEISTKQHSRAESTGIASVEVQPTLTVGSDRTSVTIRITDKESNGSYANYDMHFVLKDADGNTVWEDKIPLVRLKTK